MHQAPRSPELDSREVSRSSRTSSHLDFISPTHCVRRVIGTRKHFCKETRPPTWEGKKAQGIFRNASPRCVSTSTEDGGFTVGTFPANLGQGIVKLRVSLFVSSVLATSFPCAQKHGSAICSCWTSCVHILQKKKAVGSSGADGSKKHVSRHTTQVPCVKLRAKNRGEPFRKDPEQKDDKERGTIQSCWLCLELG